MSKELDPGEFSSAIDRAVRTTGPADFRRQQKWLDDWKLATDRMRYLKIEHLGLSDSLRALIRIRGVLRKPNLNLEFIKPDVVALWGSMSAQAPESYHTFFPGQDGFECAFLSVSADSYITGSVVIKKYDGT